MTIRAKPLPAVTSTVAPDLRRFLDRLRETFEDPNGLVTKTELLDTGAFKNSNAGNLQYVEPGEELSYIAPPAPLNLAATGAMTSITLTWSGINYNSGYAYTEVWRASADNLGAAVLIGTTTSGMYADAVGSDASHYYWVRFVNVLDDKGPFNATSGVAGATAPDLAYVLSQLSSAYGATSDAPFFQLDNPTTINGVTVAAGTYIKEAKIHNGQITNAKIGALAVDAAKIANATIVNAKIADGTIETAKIKDANITTAKIASLARTPLVALAGK
jgi:predicted phage tail protein